MTLKGGLKNLITITVVSAMLLTSLLGCSSKPSDKGTGTAQASTETSTTGNSVTTASGVKVNLGPGKIVDTPVTLNYWLEMAAGKVTDVVKNMNETRLYQEMEKRTGVKINFLHPPTGQAQEQFNLMVASRELPDIIEYDWTKYPGGPEKAVSDGIIISLNELIDKYSPNFKKYMNDNPEIKKQTVTDSGKFTNYPFIRGEVELCVNFGPMFRKDWLDELGLPIPQTLDDWYITLKAFKEKKGATAPFTFDLIRFPSSSLIVNAFGIGSEFYRDGNTIKFGPTEKPYKDFLALFSKWYSEGLIDKDFASQDAKALDAKVTGSKAGAVAGLQNGGMGTYMSLMYGKGTKFELVGAPFPGMKAGDVLKYDNRNWQMSSGNAAITTVNKYPEVSARYLDYGYGPDGITLFNYGIEGENFTMVNGKPKYTDAIIKPAKGSVSNALSPYVRTHWNGPFVQLNDPQVQLMTFPQQIEAVEKYWSKAGGFDTRVPPISPLPSESAKFGSEMNDVRTYYNEHYLKMIMGQEPLDNFDKFVSDMKRLGLDDILKIYNSALERYNKR